MRSLAQRAIAAAAVALAIAAAAHSQTPSPGCDELGALVRTKAEVAKSLAGSEGMAQTLLDLAKTKMEEIEACKGQSGQPSCTAGELALRRDEVRQVMAQVRELRAARASIEAALKEVDTRVREMAEKLKDTCPDAQR